MNLPAIRPEPIVNGPSMRMAAALAVALLLSACGGNGTDGPLTTGEAGGGAGDGDLPPGAVSPVEPFVGLWDITGNWSGLPDVPNDEATLVVRPVRANGEAEVYILDYDDGFQNCSYRIGGTGTASASPVDGRVFLDQVGDFDNAVLTLDAGGNLLTLEYVDQNDIDADGDRRDVVTYQASRIEGLSEVDIELCR